MSDEPSITCTRCGRTSYSTADIVARYCGFCDAYQVDLEERATMPLTMKDVEGGLAQEVLLERLRENAELARSAIQMCAILVMKLGGEVEITNQDVLGIQPFDLARIDRVEDGVMVLRVERRRAN